MKYAILAYGAWGFFPAYWKLLKDLPATEILCHRIVWAFLFYSAFLRFRREGVFDFSKQSRKIWGRMALTTSLLSCNWYLYIYAVNSGHVIESSLGYFINPLVNVALGVILLKEKLNLNRWIALVLAFAGVTWLSFQSEGTPWIALTLGVTFGFYGLLRKTTAIDSVQGGQMEALMMIVPAFVAGSFFMDGFHFPNYTAFQLTVLILSGVVTGLPLIWFAEAARITPLNMMGFIQYISPSIQFLLGVLVFGESFGVERLVGFGFIWLALAVFAVDTWKITHRAP